MMPFHFHNIFKWREISIKCLEFFWTRSTQNPSHCCFLRAFTAAAPSPWRWGRHYITLQLPWQPASKSSPAEVPSEPRSKARPLFFLLTEIKLLPKERRIYLEDSLFQCSCLLSSFLIENHIPYNCTTVQRTEDTGRKTTGGKCLHLSKLFHIFFSTTNT